MKVMASVLAVCSGRLPVQLWTFALPMTVVNIIELGS
jgi:hypothetical protein